MHLVGFIIRIYHDARSSECKKKKKLISSDLKHQFLSKAENLPSSQMKVYVNRVHTLFKLLFSYIACMTNLYVPNSLQS